MDILETDGINLEPIIGFTKIISDITQVKKEMDRMIRTLRRYKIYHNGIAVSKVLNKNVEKKTIEIQVGVLINNDEKEEQFLKENSQYEKFSFKISNAYKISINNSQEQFKKAVLLFMEKQNMATDDINKYDLKNNPIIELSHITHDGTVIGFDLYLEKK